jgi:DNA-binding response OmpR family regulator
MSERKKILVIEDDSDCRDLISLILEDDYAISTVADGEEAMKAIERDTPDIVLLDIMIPRIDGWEVLRRIRSDDRYKNLVVLAVTALASEESRQRAIREGATDYVIKPFDPEELLEVVATYAK